MRPLRMLEVRQSSTCRCGAEVEHMLDVMRTTPIAAPVTRRRFVQIAARLAGSGSFLGLIFGCTTPPAPAATAAPAPKLTTAFAPIATTGTVAPAAPGGPSSTPADMAEKQVVVYGLDFEPSGWDPH